MTNATFTIKKIKRGNRTLFTPLLNGHRLTKTNFARKYDAKGLIKCVCKPENEAHLKAMVAKTVAA